MGIITKMLKQTAVYWAPTGADAFGLPTYDTPLEVSARWEDRVEQFVDEQSTVQQSKAVVYVGQDVLVGGVLLLGALGSSVDQDDPKANTGAAEIRAFNKLPDIRAREYLRTVYI